MDATGAILCGYYGKYLRLPTMVGRSKYNTFRSIKERILHKIRNWKNNFLSTAGNEILIKAALQSIPTFTTSVFKLPSKLCVDIEEMLSKFGWCNNQDGKGVHWQKWDKMGDSKHKGGMGYIKKNTTETLIFLGKVRAFTFLYLEKYVVSNEGDEGWIVMENG